MATVAEILQGADEIASPQNQQTNPETNLLPGQPVNRKGKPTGKPNRSTEDLSLDEVSSDSASGPSQTGSRSRSRTVPHARPTTASTPIIDEGVAAGVKGELHVKLAMAGGLVMMALPATGMAITMRSEMASEAIVEVLKDHPKRFKQLQRLLAASKYSDLALAGASVLTAAALDMRLIRVESMAVQLTIPDVVQSVREKMAAAQQAQVQANRTAGDNSQSNGQAPQSSNLFDSPAVFTEEDAIAAGFYTPPQHSNGGVG